MTNRSRHERGFTLIEMLITLFVGALLIMISYNVLVSQKRAGDAQNQLVSAQQNASVALESLEKDLRQAGLNIDDFNGQPVFVDAAPYQVIFNADISSGIYGVPSMSKTKTVYLNDGTTYSPGGHTGEKIGTLLRYNNNAETIRYTFDRDGNGIVNTSDRYTETQNPSDYALYREENGTRSDMVAYGLRGKENYPDGQLPQPLFKYYGDFNSDGVVRLWGDTDGNGQLSQAEIAALTAVTVANLSKIVEVEISAEAESPNMEASYVGPHSASGAERKYRSVVMTSKVRPRNVGTGSVDLHACGDPPGSPTSLTAVDTPKDAGESIKLTFTASVDELSGEKDVDSYTLYRRASGETDWTCIGSISPTGGGTYTIYDDIHTLDPPGGPELGTQYYYIASAWDCRPQESSPSNIAGPIEALANGPQPPTIINAYDTPCDEKAEVTVVIGRSSDDQASGGTISNYQIYRGSTPTGSILSKTLIGSVTANGSVSYTFLDNATNNVALVPPEAGSYYCYIARAVSLDTIPSINSNEYGPIYYSGTISACQITAVADYPDDDGEALTVEWKKSASEDCVPSVITRYEVKRISIGQTEFSTVATVAAVGTSTYTYVDEGLTRGNKYTYCVWTESLTESVPSNEESGIPLRNTDLDPPENLQANDILCDATGAIEVTFEKAPQDYSGGRVTHYVVYRRTESTSAAKVGEVTASASDSYLFTDGPTSNPSSPPVIGEYYYYFATTNDRDHSLESSASNEGYTMSDGEPGAARITDAIDTPMDAGNSITLTFDRSADDGHCTNNVIIYRIYRATSSTGPFTAIIGTKTATGALSYTYYDDETFSSSPPVDGIAYYYCVRAYDGTKESVNSNIIGPIYSICQDPSAYIVFEDGFETNTGWTHGRIRTEDDWQRGTPNGKGGGMNGNNDPTSAHSGTNVYGNDLGNGMSDGRYSSNTENYLVTPAGKIDCTHNDNVVVQFYRWLNVEGPAYDQAIVEISTNGTSGPWTEVWRNSAETKDNAWTFVQIDVSDYADRKSNVAIRFRLKSDGNHNYAGWNIDDFVVREKPVTP
ncbi:MAG: choice-of-anchor J domain-containing protein [Candidatus Krumholzibacteria bacterium]|nr:choice-of-anchor J domain-containing protein [Candidatus Krumholzibacteria bacterium]